MPTVIVHCTCKHKHQDQAYGKQMRAMNTMKEKDKVRCTVCGEVRTHYHGEGE